MRRIAFSCPCVLLLLIASCEDHNGDSRNYRTRSSLENIAIGAENLDPAEMEKASDVESLRRVFTAEDDPITKEHSAAYWTDGWGVPMQLDRTEAADSLKNTYIFQEQ